MPLGLTLFSVCNSLSRFNPKGNTQMITIGSKVSYTTSEGTEVLGKIIAHGKDKWGPLNIIKVTSRSIKAYPVGSVFVAPPSEFLWAR